MTVGTQLDVSVVMKPSPSRFGGPITDEWGPTIRYNGQLYPGIIVSCEHHIFPGESGNLIIAVLHSEDLDFRQGDCLELTDGPQLLVATATVTSVVGRK